MSPGLWQLHLVGAAQEPIDAHIELVRNMSEPVDVEGSQARKVKVHGGGRMRIVCHLAQPAGFSKMIAKY